MEEQAERVQRKNIVEESTPYILCILSVTCHAGYSIIAKVALDKGMSCYVLVFYGYAFATLTTALLAFIFERNNDSKMTVQIILNIIILGFLRGIIATTLFYVGLKYTSPVFASALANTVPSITFILAVSFRLEKFEISKWITQAKIWGTIVALGGATIMTFYKGISVLSIHGSKYSHNSASSALVLTVDAKWIKGSLLLFVSYVSFSAFFILQTITVKLYPAPMTLTSLACLAGTFLSLIMAAILDHKASSWKLTWNITLLAPLYSGVVIFGVTIYLQTLVLKKKGPVFVTAFRPLSTLIVAIMSLLILGEALHLGSVLGAVLIIIGMYAILWGKKKENGKIASEPSVAITTKDIEKELPEK